MEAETRALDEEVHELLTNYRNARRSSREPCAMENYTECLAALQEELNVLNVRYVFNPYTDVCKKSQSLRPAALVELINAVFSLLQEHKHLTQSASTLALNNHTLEKTNAHLNGKVGRLMSQLERSEREQRACLAEAARSAAAAEEARGELRGERARLAQLQSRAAAGERAQRVRGARLERENERLQDRCRDKSGTYVSSGEVKEGAVRRMREQETFYKATISKLQAHNNQLLDEVLALKDDLLTQSLSTVRLQER